MDYFLHLHRDLSFLKKVGLVANKSHHHIRATMFLQLL